MQNGPTADGYHLKDAPLLAVIQTAYLLQFADLQHRSGPARPRAQCGKGISGVTGDRPSRAAFREPVMTFKCYTNRGDHNNNATRSILRNLLLVIHFWVVGNRTLLPSTRTGHRFNPNATAAPHTSGVKKTLRTLLRSPKWQHSVVLDGRIDWLMLFGSCT